MILSNQLKNPMENNNEKSQAVYFLVELRAKLISSLCILMVFFAILTYFSNTIYSLLAQPLLKFIPEGHLIATQIMSPFFVPFKLAFCAALLLTMPVFLYQVWTFIAPALYGHERRLVWPLLLTSTSLFYGGIVFAYLAILPILFQFLVNTAPHGVMISPDITVYLNFTLGLLLSFGILFEIPIAMTILVSTNIITRQRFIAVRSYAIVGAFILGMLIAPPDVLSQTIIAIPICLLYELGIALSRFVKKG